MAILTDNNLSNLSKIVAGLIKGNLCLELFTALWDFDSQGLLVHTVTSLF